MIDHVTRTAVVLLATLVLATPAAAQTAIPLLPVQAGFSDGALTRPKFPVTTYVSKLSDAGAQLHRVTLTWQWAESTRGQPNWSYFKPWDDLYNRELAVGIRQVIVLFGSPRWAIDPDARGPLGGAPCTVAAANCFAPPNVRDPAIRDAWKGWVRAVVTRYPQAAAIEVWNEPNLSWSWVIAQDPALYGLLVAATTEAVHSLRPATPVLAGALAGYNGADTPSATSMTTMMENVFASAGNDGFDAISYHSYPCANEPATARLQRDIDRMRQIKSAHGVSTRGLWITETGALSSGTSAANCNTGFKESTQGPALGAVIDWARAQQMANGDLPAVLMHNLYNSAPRSDLNTPLSGEAEFGLVAWRWNSSGAFESKDKPAYAKVRCKFRNMC